MAGADAVSGGLGGYASMRRDADPMLHWMIPPGTGPPACVQTPARLHALAAALLEGARRWNRQAAASGAGAGLVAPGVVSISHDTLPGGRMRRTVHETAWL